MSTNPIGLMAGSGNDPRSGSGSERSVVVPPSTGDVGAREGRSSLTAIAEFILETRRWREACFTDGLFGEPAWDVLLVLFSAAERKKDLHQAEVIALAHVPKTTAGRVFDRLETDGLIRRRGGRDIRKRYVSLTDDGKRRMTRLLTTLARELTTKLG